MRPVSSLAATVIALAVVTTCLAMEPTPVGAAASQLQWVTTGGSAIRPDTTVSAVRGNNGFLYVVGVTSNGPDLDYRIMKIRESDGLIDRNVTYNGGYGDDRPRACSFYGGRLYVTGESQSATGDLDYLTLSFNASDLSVQWTRAYDRTGRDDEAYAVVANAYGVYVTGESHHLGGARIVTLGYTHNGALLSGWPRIFPSGTTSFATGIAADANGNLYICGAVNLILSGYDCLVLAYTASGVDRWNEIYDGSGSAELDIDILRYITVSGSTLYTCGQVWTGLASRLDWIVWTLDLAGGTTGRAFYDGPGNGEDVATSLAVDNAGQFWVTGRVYNPSGLGSSYCGLTRRYNASCVYQCGDMLSSETPYVDSYAYSVAVNADRYAFVAGQSGDIAHRPAMVLTSNRYADCSRQTIDRLVSEGATSAAGRIVLADGYEVYIAGDCYRGSNRDIMVARYSMCLEPLPPPERLSPENGATCVPVNGVLDWTDVPSATGYKISFGQVGGFAQEFEVSESHFEYSGLPLDSMFAWKVRTRDRCNAYGSYNATDFIFNTWCPSCPVEERSLSLVNRLYNAEPNPFNPQTTIRFSTAGTNRVRIRLLDTSGRVVRTLIDEMIKPGDHSVHWDGRSDAGQVVGAGLYWAQMKAGSYVSSKKLVLVK